MSATVAKAVRIMGGAAAEETANFIEMVDKLFDCLNVSSLSKGRRQAKLFVRPYERPTDFRLRVQLFCYIIYGIYFCCCSFLKKSYFLTLISGKRLYRPGKDTQKNKLI